MKDVDMECVLGGISLDAEDFCGLRPGMEMQFQGPERFSVQLRVSGQEWAEAEARSEGKHMILELKKFATFHSIAREEEEPNPKRGE